MNSPGTQEYPDKTISARMNVLSIKESGNISNSGEKTETPAVPDPAFSWQDFSTEARMPR